MRFARGFFLLASAFAAFACVSAADCEANIPAAPTDATPASDEVLMYVGAYTADAGMIVGYATGISTYSLNTRTGELTLVSEVDVGINPTFIRGTAVRSGKKQLLYATNECAEPSVDVPGTSTGYVVAIEVTGRGQLKVLSRVETRGVSPLHVSLSPNEDFVAVASYFAGGVVLYPVNSSDGSLAPTSDSHFYTEGSMVEPSRQEAAHPHSTTWVPDSNVLLAADLGSDKIMQYTIDASAKKIDNTTLPVISRPAGYGPRHMTINPSGDIMYVVDELSNTVAVYPLNEDGSLLAKPIQTISTLPVGYTNVTTAADIHASEDGKFVYASNRGHDSIAIFKVKSEENGTLEWVGTESTRGKTPRSFLVYKDFLVAAHQDSDNIEVFKRNADGTLTHSGFSVSTSAPVSLFIPPAY